MGLTDVTRFSDMCRDLSTYWDEAIRRCVPCERKPGYQITPNCGRDDNQGIHTDSFTKCEPDTFNDGSSARCLDCSQCPIGFSLLKNCTSTSDTVCQEVKTESTTVTLSVPTINTFEPYSPQNTALWALPIIIIFSLLLVAVGFVYKRKKRKGVWNNPCYKRRISIQNEGFSSISSGTNTELEDILNAKILSAPLHAVLDDLDVLEELVILLDPDTQGIKSTKHLASHCSFSSTWITYAYSMKDSKSPLKAVLEGVTSKQPDWTVGHLAKLLRQMDRNDAITVLAKLRPGPKASNL